MKKNVSIITPYYNTNIVTFKKLCDSLKRQNREYFEWIIIDDCSEKNNFEQLQRCLSEYGFDYTLVSNDSNLGAGKSRNVGISLAKAKYIVFVDSDDFVHNSFIETINQMIVDSCEGDILLFDYARISEGKEKECVTVRNANNGILERDVVIENITSNICGKLIKKSIIQSNEISFLPISRFEDWDYVTCCLVKAEKIYYNKKVLYYYVDNENSSVHRNKDAVGNSIQAFDHIRKFSNMQQGLLQKLFVREVLYVAIKQYGRFEKLDEFKKKMKEVHEIMPTAIGCLKECNFALHQKIILYFYRFKMYGVLKVLLRII